MRNIFATNDIIFYVLNAGTMGFLLQMFFLCITFVNGLYMKNPCLVISVYNEKLCKEGKIRTCQLNFPEFTFFNFFLTKKYKYKEFMRNTIITILLFYSSGCLCGILHIRSTVGCQMLTLYCVGRLQKYFLYAQMSIQVVLNMHLQ